MGSSKSLARRALEKDVRKVVRLYVDDLKTMAEIGAMYGTSKEVVRPVLLDAGVTLRSAGGHHTRRTPPEAPTVETVRARAPLPLDMPADGDIVGLREIRTMAGFTGVQLAEIIGLQLTSATHIERKPLKNTALGIIARHVDGCGARLRVVVDFPGQETLVLFDSYHDGEADG